MEIRIRKKGAPPPSDDDVVSRLAACHTRIRAFLAEARALARGGGSAEARKASAAAVARYFAEALPLHAQDEDATITPHLPRSAQALSRRLAADHERIEADLRTLGPDWERWAAGDTTPASTVHVETVERVSADLLAHLALEEADLFPLLTTIPSVIAKKIIEDMKDRRG